MPGGTRRWADGADRRGALATVVALVATGSTMLGLSISTGTAPLRLIGELLAGGAVVASGVLIASALRSQCDRVKVGLLPGELALDGALVYLGLAMSGAHHGGGGASWALLQFVAVLVGLVAGAAGLSLVRAQRSSSGRGTLTVVVRDGVLLVVGSLLVAIAVGEAARPALVPPHWNWISFVGLTIPGMIVLLGRERLKDRASHHPHQPRQRSRVRAVSNEMLLLVGLAVMVFGSTANLTMGKDGFVAGFVGDGRGLAFWVAGAAFLVAGRGLWKIRCLGSLGSSSRAAGAGLLYLVGVTVFVVGERAVQLGHGPSVPLSAASSAFAALVLLAAALVLGVLRPVAATRLTPATARAQSAGVGPIDAGSEENAVGTGSGRLTPSHV
jgi:hypothetical protein